MFKKILAVVVAAVCAAVIVGFIPAPAPAVAAGTPQAVHAQLTGNSESSTPAVVAARIPEIGRIGCTHGWPYYEPSCLRDDRRPDGKARVVRVVTANHASAVRQTRR
jgi:hypothetical protein